MSLFGLMHESAQYPAAKVISELVTVRYINFLISLLYRHGSSSV